MKLYYIKGPYISGQSGTYVQMAVIYTKHLKSAQYEKMVGIHYGYTNIRGISQK